QEREEIAIISAYLPKQMSEDEMKAAIAAAIAETGAAGMKDMGEVIGVLRAKFALQMDFGKASGMVKAALTSWARLRGPRICSRSSGLRRYRLGERVKGTNRTGATARIVVLSGAIFSTTVRCSVPYSAPTRMTSRP